MSMITQQIGGLTEFPETQKEITKVLELINSDRPSDLQETIFKNMELKTIDGIIQGLFEVQNYLNRRNLK